MSHTGRLADSSIDKREENAETEGEGDEQEIKKQTDKTLRLVYSSAFSFFVLDPADIQFCDVQATIVDGRVVYDTTVMSAAHTTTHTNALILSMTCWAVSMISFVVLL